MLVGPEIRAGRCTDTAAGLRRFHLKPLWGSETPVLAGGRGVWGGVAGTSKWLSSTDHGLVECSTPPGVLQDPRP